MTADHHPDSRRRWLILAFIGLAQLMVVLDATIVNIALPSAQKRPGLLRRRPAVDRHRLRAGLRQPAAARRPHRRPVRAQGASSSGWPASPVASALGGARESFGVLVAARALQGVFAALLAPAALSPADHDLHRSRRSAPRPSASSAPSPARARAVGLILGGVLTEYLNWRWAMYVNLVFAVPVAFAALRAPAAPSGARDSGRQHRRPRRVTVSAGLFAPGLRLLQRRDARLGLAADDLGLLAAGAVLLAAFVAMADAASQHPLLPLRVVLDRDRGGVLPRRR